MEKLFSHLLSASTVGITDGKGHIIKKRRMLPKQEFPNSELTELACACNVFKTWRDYE
jgi:hypothetical protein